VSADDSIDRRFTLGLQPGNAATRILEVARNLFRFEFSFGVLAGGAIAFTRQTFRLLSEAFECAFELASNLANTFGDCRLR